MNLPTDWKANFDKLEAYHQKHGHFNVPFPNRRDEVFSRWVENIRRHPEKLPADLHKELLRIGFDFGTTSDWDSGFLKLKEFYHMYGHTYIPRDQKEYESLFDWTLSQKRARSLLSVSQVQKLVSVGFDWTLLSDADVHWEEMYKQLVAFKEEFGHLKVSYEDKEKRPLRDWIKAQRAKQFRLQLSEYRIKKLNELGFIWRNDIQTAKNEGWEGLYQKFKLFKEEHGDKYHVPLGEHPHLKKWVENQIRAKDLAADKKEKLNNIGFVWDRAGLYREELWENMYAKLLAYKDKYGHCNVPSGTSEHKVLASWVGTQRSNNIPEDRRNKLYEIGFLWAYEAEEEKWHNKLREYNDLKANDPLGQLRDGAPLYSWVYQQRVHFYRLPQDKQKLLLQAGVIGFTEIPADPKLRRQVFNIAASQVPYLSKIKPIDWRQHVDKLKTYYQEFGNFDVPFPEYPDMVFSFWVENIRRHPNQLPAGLATDLLGIGFSLGASSQWDTGFGQLKAFHKKYGHVDVPPLQKEYEALFEWILNQKRTQPLLTARQVEKLTSLGFDWTVLSNSDTAWEENYLQLVAFKKQYGHTSVSFSYKEHKPLMNWVKTQRVRQTANEMSENQIKKLNALGFLWSDQIQQTLDDAWEQRYAELIAYLKSPRNKKTLKFSRDQRQLKDWVKALRKHRDKLPPEKIRQLDAIGFDWDRGKVFEALWDEMYARLVAYKEAYGHNSVSYSRDLKLANWLEWQRKTTKKILLPQRREKLDQLGIVWSNEAHLEARWMTRYQELKTFQERFGHLNVPVSGKKLYNWVSLQRKQKQRNAIIKEREDLLNEIGFTWTGEVKMGRVSLWEIYYENFRLLKEQHGEAYLMELKKNPEMAAWVARQIESKKQLSPPKRKKLNEIGFTWGLSKDQKKWFERLKEYSDLKERDELLSICGQSPMQSWIYQQRKNFHKLSDERKKSLLEAGIVLV